MQITFLSILALKYNQSITGKKNTSFETIVQVLLTFRAGHFTRKITQYYVGHLSAKIYFQVSHGV